jgi:proton-translocating NADH-quinone oxidoreductase chain M
MLQLWELLKEIWIVLKEIPGRRQDIWELLTELPGRRGEIWETFKEMFLGSHFYRIMCSVVKWTYVLTDHYIRSLGTKVLLLVTSSMYLYVWYFLLNFLIFSIFIVVNLIVFIKSIFGLDWVQVIGFGSWLYLAVEYDDFRKLYNWLYLVFRIIYRTIVMLLKKIGICYSFTSIVSFIRKLQTSTKHRLLFFSLLLFLLNLYWLYKFDPYINSFQSIWVLDFFGYYVYFGLDGISLTFTFLTSFFIPLCILFIWNTKFQYKNQYLYFLLSVEILIIFVFLVLDLVWFYILFEAILIPFFLLIGLYGSRIRKIHAAYLLFFYTVCGSIWMLLSIIYIYIHTGTTNIQLLWSISYTNLSEHLLWLSFFISFSVKIPIFPLHIWLPEAHVESPTEASVILAAILLKIGLYGVLRFLIPMFPYISFYYSNLIILLNILSMVYTSLITLRQIDIKRIIAYSSVGHMNICMIGLVSFDIHSIIGSLIIMVGHGFISGGLFFLIGILYDRYKTKLIIYYSGIFMYMPIYSSILFFFILSNISMPFTSNFIGELLILYKVANEHHITLLISISFAIFMCTVYSIWLYNRICFGILKYKSFKTLRDVSFLEFSILVPIMLFVLLIGIYPDFFIQLWSSNIYYYFMF